MTTGALVVALVLAAFAAGFVYGRRRAPAFSQVLDANRAVLESERARGIADCCLRRSRRSADEQRDARAWKNRAGLILNDARDGDAARGRLHQK